MTVLLLLLALCILTSQLTSVLLALAFLHSLKKS